MDKRKRDKYTENAENNIIIFLTFSSIISQIYAEPTQSRYKNPSEQSTGSKG